MQPKDLMTRADRYTGHVGIKLSTVGAYCANDGKFFRRLSDGSDCRTKMAQKVSTWFSENWSADLEWPRDIPRPPKNK
ncbi:hypothetical protein, partial [Rhodobacter lacus]